MSDKTALFLGSLVMMAIAVAIFKAADPLAELLGRAADRWRQDGVVHGPAMLKVWEERSPRKFKAMTGLYDGASVVFWLSLKGFAILLGLAAVGSLLLAAAGGR